MSFFILAKTFPIYRGNSLNCFYDDTSCHLQEFKILNSPFLFQKHHVAIWLGKKIPIADRKKILFSNFLPYQFLLEYKKSLFEEQQQWTASSTVILRLQVIAKGNIQIGSICIQQAATALLFPLALASLAYWVALRLLKIRLDLIPNYKAWYSISRDLWKIFTW